MVIYKPIAKVWLLQRREIFARQYIDIQFTTIIVTCFHGIIEILNFKNHRSNKEFFHYIVISGGHYFLRKENNNNNTTNITWYVRHIYPLPDQDRLSVVWYLMYAMCIASL